LKSINIKQEAINLREKGDSYSMIASKLQLSKSTLSDWLKEIPYKPNHKVIKRIGLARIKSAQSKHNLKMVNILEARKIAKSEIGNLTKRDLLMLGIGLYWGEGSKSNEIIRFVNSDPSVIKIAVEWFERICEIKKNNFAPRIHIYPDSDVKNSIKYWSGITGVSQEQFKKTQIDRRKDKSGKKKHKLPNGTLHLQINSCGEVLKGRFLHRKIMGWINACLEQILRD